MNKFKYLVAIAFIVISGCSSISHEQKTVVETVNNVDLDKYKGKWYEIASIPQYFQQGCSCTTAEYTQMDGYIKVFNSCVKNGNLSEIEGKAFIEPDSNNSKLKVQFFPPFKADYWIVDRDENYSYAVVSNPKMSYMWILSRTPRMNAGKYKSIVDNLKSKGFPVEKLNRTLQFCGTR